MVPRFQFYDEHASQQLFHLKKDTEGRNSRKSFGWHLRIMNVTMSVGQRTLYHGMDFFCRMGFESNIKEARWVHIVRRVDTTR